MPSIPASEYLSLIERLKPEHVAVIGALAALELLLEVVRIVSLSHLTVNAANILRFTPPFIAGLPVAFLAPSRILGEAGRVVFFHKLAGVDEKTAASAVLNERLLDFLLLAAASALLLTSMSGSQSSQLLAASAVIIALITSFFALARLVPYSKIARISPFLHNKELEKYYEAARKTAADSKTFLTASMLTIAIWLVDFFRVSYIFSLFNAKPSFLEVAGSTSISYIVGVLSMLPGGLGSFEFSGTFVYGLLGIDAATALPALLMERLFSFWAWALIGGALIVSYGSKVK